jgi:hypothetical protein
LPSPRQYSAAVDHLHEDVMIKELARGHVDIEFEGKRATIQGEAYLRGYGSPDFVIYENTFLSWSSPDEHEPLDDGTKRRVLSALVATFKDQGLTAIVE